MKIRLYNARILTMQDGIDIISNGEIWVYGERIEYVGKSVDIIDNDIVWDIEKDCNNNLLMPGFKNAHTHSAMTAFRTLADDMPLQEWLFDKIFPLEAKLCCEDVYVLVQLAILEYLTSGITGIFDMYMFPESTSKACVDMGMRLVMSGDLNKFGPSLQELEDRFVKYNNYHPLVSYKLGVHAEYTCTKDILEEVSKLTHKYKEPFYTHLVETKREADECVNNYGVTAPSLLESIGLFDYGGGGYHSVYTTQDDRAIYKDRGVYAITNPSSNLKLASGIAPISSYIDMGIPVAIGTDGASSNNCLDMFREMFLVTGLAKLREMNASAVPPSEVIKMATVNGSGAMGLLDCDILAKGKYADIIMIDLHQPNMQPINNIVDNIVYAGTKMNVTMTMINGKILYSDYVFECGVNVEEIYDKANSIIRRLEEDVKA